MNFKLRTDRLFLRLVQDCDAEPAFDILHSHPDITRFMTFNPPKKVDDTLQFFRESRLHCPEKGVVWALFLEEKFIGLVSLESITRMLGVWKMDRAELGYWLDPSFHGQGIMTEAASEVMRFGFEHLNLHKIICGHVSENIASQKVIEKLGFRFLSERKEHFFRFGQWWNHKNYEIIKDEFESSGSIVHYSEPNLKGHTLSLRVRHGGRSNLMENAGDCHASPLARSQGQEIWDFLLCYFGDYPLTARGTHSCQLDRNEVEWRDLFLVL
ncbi:GNAT family N-acetyltransferase [Candidatus Gracilibacteria bacterium]|nr:GNAT family N-acetyltransferase [Candidatus Gracilibacteria bacterium]